MTFTNVISYLFISLSLCMLLLTVIIKFELFIVFITDCELIILRVVSRDHFND